MTTDPSPPTEDPNLDRIVSQACTATQFIDPHYHRIVALLPQFPKFHRKQWEYVYIIRALEQFGMLVPGKRGLGFGCGKEPLAGVMVNHGLDVMVTDIPPVVADSNWGTRSVMDSYYEGLCPRERYAEHVQFRSIDMNHIPDDLGTYDFVWSCCALEHLGSLQAGMDFIVNANKCLQPGGIAIHTTEFNVGSDDETLDLPNLALYRRQDFLKLQTRLQESGCSLLPLNFATGTAGPDLHIDLPPYEWTWHLKVMIERFTVTSFGLVVAKHR